MKTISFVQSEKLLNFRQFVDELVHDVAVESTYDEKGVVVVGSQISLLDMVCTIAEVLGLKPHIKYGHPPTDYEGATNPVMYVLVKG